jgi:hypothetical protein
VGIVSLKKKWIMFQSQKFCIRSIFWKIEYALYSKTTLFMVRSKSRPRFFFFLKSGVSTIINLIFDGERSSTINFRILQKVYTVKIFYLYLSLGNFWTNEGIQQALPPYVYWPKFLTPHFYISKIWKPCQSLRSIDINIVCGLHSWTVGDQKLQSNL